MPRILTSSDGYFVFRDIPADKFDIIATKRGYTDGRYGRLRPSGPSQQLTVGAAERVGDIVIKLFRHASISGIVTDEAGEPLVRVFVRALRKSIVGGRATFVANAIAITDDRGIYRLGSLTPGEYVVVTASRQAALPMSAAHQANTGIDSLIMSIGGTNRLPGNPTAIETSDAVFPLGQGTPIPAPSADGRLFIYPPTFHPSGNLTQAATVTIGTGEERTGIDLRLDPVATVRVSGRVVAPEGVGGVLPVRLRPSGGDPFALEQDWPGAIADANGQFVLPAVPSGDYTLRVASTRQPMYWAEVPLLVGRSDIEGLAVTLQPGLRISGRLAFDGQSTAPPTQLLGQVPVVIEAAGDNWPISRAPAISFDSNGNFTSDALPGGRYFVRVSGSPAGWMFTSAMHNGRDLSEVPLDLKSADAAGVVITFTDRWTSLSGIVHPHHGVTGIHVEATVLVFPVDPQMWHDAAPNPRRIRSTTTGKIGEFNFASLPPGEYYALAVVDESADDWQDPAFMQTLARSATRVAIGEGEHKKQDLRITEVR
jgi:hypothetical protein